MAKKQWDVNQSFLYTVDNKVIELPQLLIFQYF